jgi:GDP/UDP-N,N'-diacetylbacillosamine 2-epimerase (hydrolysing)
MGPRAVSRARPTRHRRIAVVTGTRAEYGLLKSALQAIAAHPRLSLQLVVTGMHLLPKFGRTIDDIVRDGWRIDARVPMQAGTDRPDDQAQGLAHGVAGIARYLHCARTNIVLVLGDRIEAMAGALAAVTTDKVLAHIHGGDVAPGDFDETLRHAITKLAHIHLAASRGAARRIVRLGESSQRVHCVGAIGLDRLRELLAEIPRRRGPSNEALVVYHAWGRPADVEARTMRSILNTVQKSGLRRLILFPNSDRGHRGVLRAIEQHRRACPPGDVQVVRSLPRDEYLRALLRADVLVGHSSSGVLEAPLAGTPAVNVGGRQAHREPGGPAVFPCGESQPAIAAALRRALRTRVRRGGRSVYGDGHAGERIAHILAATPLTDQLLRKVITY